MTLDVHINSYRIACCVGEQGARPANISQVADKKSTTENNDNSNNIDTISSAPTLNKHQKARLIKGKKEVIIPSLNVQTLRNFQFHELVASGEVLLNDIGCVQEHRYIHEEVQIKKHDARKHWKVTILSAWKSNVNVSVGRITMSLSPHAYKALSSIEKLRYFLEF